MCFLSLFPRLESYLMGSGERLEIQTEILNSGEDAFNALLEVQVPRGLNYINANTTDGGTSILCSPPTPRNNNTLLCEVGNPLRAGKQVSQDLFTGTYCTAQYSYICKQTDPPA